MIYGGFMVSVTAYILRNNNNYMNIRPKTKLVGYMAGLPTQNGSCPTGGLKVV
jgi:hypothetical protein